LLVGADLATQQRAHGVRRRALHSISLALARHPGLVAHTWTLIEGRADRLARIAAIFDFVHRAAAGDALPPAATAQPATTPMSALRDGDVTAALMAAMLRAAGERATVAFTREMAFVRVAVGGADVAQLPPWARPLRFPGGRLEVGLAPGRQWTPPGYLPAPAREGLHSRRRSLARAS